MRRELREVRHVSHVLTRVAQICPTCVWEFASDRYELQAITGEWISPTVEIIAKGLGLKQPQAVNSARLECAITILPNVE